MNKVLAYEVCSELERDREFALRFQGRGHAETLVAYFTSRGIDHGDALVLALAYMAGTEHAATQIERTMDRVAAKR